MNELNQSELGIYHDRSNFFYGNHILLRPDFVFIQKGNVYRPNYCVFVAELQRGIIDNEHLGRTILYNTLTLQASPLRHFVMSVVTNLDYLILIKTERKINGDFKHNQSRAINFWKDGLEYLTLLLNMHSYAGYDPTFNISFQMPSSQYLTKFFINLYN